MSGQPTVVLVHGAFADASGYAQIINRLEADGIAVRAPMNPLRSLAGDAEAIARYTSTIDGPIILVGHSYGGAVIGEAAREVKDVRGLVFLSALALDEGETCLSVQESFPPPLFATANEPSPYDAPGAAGGPDFFIKIDRFKEVFCADLPDEVANPMAVSQRPVSAAALTEKATSAGWKNTPCWYMMGEKDNAISPDCERFLAQRMSADTQTAIGGSHAAFISQPDVATGLILKAVANA